MAERIACMSNKSSESRCSTHCDDIEPVEESRADVETGSEEEEEEEEESLELEIPTVETNPKNLMRKEQQEREDCGHAVYRNWCAACVEARGVGRQFQLEPLEEEEKTNNPNGSF